jgi:PAS domain S-box-containing protein
MSRAISWRYPVRQNGSRISLEFTIVPLRDDHGQLIGLVAVLRDVTRRFEEIRSLKRTLAAARSA